MTKTLTLRSLDIPTISKFGIGFDSMLDDLMRINSQQGQSNYPPYNVIQINEDEYLISIAVAGFGPNDINVTKEKNFLIIEGVSPELEGDVELNYLHRGISRRNFRREFKLADHVEIGDANLELGILSIHLKREVPEEAKPKRIHISYTK